MSTQKDGSQANANANTIAPAKNGNKLKLNRETVRNLRVLSVEELKGIGGAAVEIDSFDRSAIVC